MRHGVLLEDLDDDQREAALRLVEQTLSASGFRTARDIMRLNHTIGEITGSWTEYGEWVYFISLFGEPSEHEPWGWQIDGHHLIVNCFVIGDQVVITPVFMGSEPVVAETGIYTGTSVLQTEQNEGLAFIHALTPSSAARRFCTTRSCRRCCRRSAASALTGASRPPPFATTCRFRTRAFASDELTRGPARAAAAPGRAVHRQAAAGPRRALAGHASASTSTRPTSCGWAAPASEDVFYYRIHSPVILIEFDHQPGIAFDSDEPTRAHIHTVVRTPNGNDYGMDYLRQHHARFDHVNGQHVPKS